MHGFNAESGWARLNQIGVGEGKKSDLFKSRLKLWLIIGLDICRYCKDVMDLNPSRSVLIRHHQERNHPTLGRRATQPLLLHFTMPFRLK